MAYINISLKGVSEPEVVPEGMYDLRIVKAEDGESKKGNSMTTVTIRIEDAPIPNPNLVNHWITYPNSNTPEDQKYMRLLDTKRFLTLFDIPHDEGGFDTEDLVGATARALLVQEEGTDGIIRNRLRLPRMKDGA